MGGSSETTTNTVRYAPYIEEVHNDLLSSYQNIANWLLWAPSEQILGVRPYSGYTDLLIDEAFFGTGMILTSYPGLYEHFNTYMAEFDTEELFDPDLFSQIYDEEFNRVINHAAIDELVSAEAERMSDDIEQEVMPRFETGLRDINSVISSSFVIGRSIIEDGRVKAASRFSAELHSKMLPLALSAASEKTRLLLERWKTQLQWNRDIVEMYAQIFKFYLLSRIDVDNHNFEVHAKDKLWPFSILEQYRLAVGTLHGAQNVKTDVAGASTAQKALGGAMMGASAGAMIGGPIGAGIGALVGLAAGFL